MLADPDDLGGGKAGQHRVAGELQHLCGADLPGDGRALGSRALVVPHDAGAQHLTLGVQQHQAVHLAGQADSGNLLRFQAALRQHLPDAGHRSSPPVGGVLLGPQRLRGEHGVLGRGAGNDLAIVGR